MALFENYVDFCDSDEVGQRERVEKMLDDPAYHTQLMAMLHNFEHRMQKTGGEG